MTFPKRVKIVEVGPRDGLQNESQWVDTTKKIELINALSLTGLSVIEVTSFVSPKWVPQLRDAIEVYQHIHKTEGTDYPVLIPNLEGLQRAIGCGVRSIAVFTSPSEKFSKANTNCTVKESIDRIQVVIDAATRANLKIRAYLSCVLGCPYEGEMAVEKVVNLAKTMLDMGCDEVSLGDTIGIGTPIKTQRLLEAVLSIIPPTQIAVHFHDTYGQALTNIYIALMHGISTIDSSIAGLGGCPYAKGVTGNVATEDVVFMLHEMGIETGINLENLIQVGKGITTLLGKRPQSKLSQI